MTKVEPITNESVESEAPRKQHPAQTLIDHILQKVSRLQLPAKEYFERYMRHKWRMNHKPRTLGSSYTSVMLFLAFYGGSGKKDLREIERIDLEAFIEHEQDRGIRLSTVRTRLACIIAFLHFLIEQDVLSGAFLKRRIKLKLPDVLPRAINPADVRRLFSVIDDIRDRALFLLLLRTGMRIGEALGLRMTDLDIQDRKIHLFEGEKNSMGRVVYLSDDALFAIKLWLRQRQKSKPFVFYGQGNKGICYSTGRNLFVKYLKRAGLEQKGYTVHCLRHTFASELLNAGMRLECLQQLLGHQDIEVTRRYARLTDKTREQEYFRAMALIEKGGIDGDY
ncbi:tyrosine-type recombinase/integrase [Candidatus Manganitrophus noduliformans]|uniref:Tyrosine-type recombinase/integrase n=1 Tax=Candidatus Manganitrophus noduliformans TaxID=2606439 RepID=A0A7X6DQX8_9BACT|nr:tyrosine-type recombinase/integrase [Candidatus Manganitrophus noduliformans]NKE71746.1 tyrosine-type recombinase/integrase [Candidatus Manganitrophus noduliformans]